MHRRPESQPSFESSPKRIDLDDIQHLRWMEEEKGK